MQLYYSEVAELDQGRADHFRYDRSVSIREGMAFHYHLRISSSEQTHDYSTFAEAVQAIPTALSHDNEPWELVRTDENPNTWIDILSGAGPPHTRTRFAELRHYPPRR